MSWNAPMSTFKIHTNFNSTRIRDMVTNAGHLSQTTHPPRGPAETSASAYVLPATKLELACDRVRRTSPWRPNRAPFPLPTVTTERYKSLKRFSCFDGTGNCQQTNVHAFKLLKASSGRCNGGPRTSRELQSQRANTATRPPSPASNRSLRRKSSPTKAVAKWVTLGAFQDRGNTVGSHGNASRFQGAQGLESSGR